MAKRRRVLMGMGALVFGSGAMSVNAAFQNSVDASGDMRVVAAEDLTIEPGISFRTGDEDSSYDSSLDGSSGKFYSGNNNDFFAASSPTANNQDDLGSDLGPSDLPAISVNDAEDGNLSIKVATLNENASKSFPEVLQIRNNGDAQKDVGVKFQKFGADTATNSPMGESGNNNDPDTREVVDAYSFKDNNSDIISTDTNHFSSNTTSINNNGVSEQKVTNTVTVSPGAVRQVDLEVDLTTTLVNEIDNASSVTGGPFAGSRDTVQLVDTIRFGAGSTGSDEEA